MGFDFVNAHFGLQHHRPPVVQKVDTGKFLDLQRFIQFFGIIDNMIDFSSHDTIYFPSLLKATLTTGLVKFEIFLTSDFDSYGFNGFCPGFLDFHDSSIFDTKGFARWQNSY